MDLIMDRFVETNDGRTIDLVSGREVTVVTSSAGGASEQMRWAQRCDWFFRLRHRSFAPLMDFGVFGEMRRFEAWDCGGLWNGASAQTEPVQRTASAFLTASGLSVGTRDPAMIRVRNEQPVVLPDPECGYERYAADPSPGSASAVPAVLALEDCGTAIINRRPVAIAAEMFSQSSGAQPRTVALWGSPGAGVRTAIQDLSRVARLNGFVPARLSVAGRFVGTLRGLRERSLFLIADDDPAAGWRGLADWLIASPRPHVLLFAGRQEVPRVDGLQLEPLSPEALANAVQPRCVDAATRSRIEEAAERANGIPGRFVQLLWGGSREPLRARTRVLRTRAAEHPALYGEDPEVREITAAGDVSWAATGELTTLRCRMDRAIGLVERGRHEPGGRALRQAIGGLARRHDWVHAARGQLALARGLLQRGRPQDAQAALDGAREYVGRTERDSQLWVEATVLTGVAWTDLARLEEAEAVLHGAVVSARANREPAQMAAAHLALARCLFWRGRHHEGAQVLASIDSTQVDACPPLTSIRVAIIASRLAVGRRDGGAAVSHASGALEAAHRLAQPAAIAHASYAAAFAHLAVGDRIAMERDIAACVQASRSARDQPHSAGGLRPLDHRVDRQTEEIRLPPAGPVLIGIRERCRLRQRDRTRKSSGVVARFRSCPVHR